MVPAPALRAAFLAHADAEPPWARRLEQRLLVHVRELLRQDECPEGVSVATPADYEIAGRQHLLAIFEDTFGLRVMQNASPHRLQGGIECTQHSDSLEWDFRVPVMCSGTAPAHPGKRGDLVIFPDMDSYIRPAFPARARRLTPTKLPGAVVDTASDFMAIFEITIAARWARDLSARLEQRLAVTLDRARALQLEGQDVASWGVLDVVAVVGVVATTSCQQSVPHHVTKAATPLLHAVMEAGRFVFVRLPFSGSPLRGSTGGSSAAHQSPEGS